MSAREVVSAEALHAEHMREFAWLEEDGFTADQCGNCQRWARYASAALAAEPAEVERLQAALNPILDRIALGHPAPFTEYAGDSKVQATFHDGSES